MRDSIELNHDVLANDVLTFYYENGITAPFDYWWITFKDTCLFRINNFW